MGFYKGAAKAKKEDDFKYEVIEKYGKIGERGTYSMELRLVKWNDNEPKYDIRSWKETEDGTEKMLKGLSFTGEELEALYNILKGIAEADEKPKAKGRK